MKKKLLLFTCLIAIAFTACKKDDDGENDIQPENHLRVGETEHEINDIFLDSENTAHKDQYLIAMTDGKFENETATGASYIGSFIINSKEEGKLASGEYKVENNEFLFVYSIMEENEEGNPEQVHKTSTDGTLSITNNDDGTFVLDFTVTLDDEQNVTGYYNGPIEEQQAN